MIYLDKAEVYHALFILSLSLKVKLVAKYFHRNMVNKLLLLIFNSTKFCLMPKNEWVAVVAFKLSIALNS